MTSYLTPFKRKSDRRRGFGPDPEALELIVAASTDPLCRHLTQHISPLHPYCQCICTAVFLRPLPVYLNPYLHNVLIDCVGHLLCCFCCANVPLICPTYTTSFHPLASHQKHKRLPYPSGVLVRGYPSAPFRLPRRKTTVTSYFGNSGVVASPDKAALCLYTALPDTPSALALHSLDSASARFFSRETRMIYSAHLGILQVDGNGCCERVHTQLTLPPYPWPI